MPNRWKPVSYTHLARVIKAVTNTPLDIPEGAEVIDVCKAVEEMMNESEERGELRTVSYTHLDVYKRQP